MLHIFYILLSLFRNNRRKLKVNVAKSKVMRSASDGIVGEMNIMMDGQVLEEVAVFTYLGTLVTAIGRVERDVQQSFGGE